MVCITFHYWYVYITYPWYEPSLVCISLLSVCFPYFVFNSVLIKVWINFLRAEKTNAFIVMCPELPRPHLHCVNYRILLLFRGDKVSLFLRITLSPRKFFREYCYYIKIALKTGNRENFSMKEKTSNRENFSP